MNTKRMNDLLITAQTAKDEEWNMKIWCGTSKCLAGHYVTNHPNNGLVIKNESITDQEGNNSIQALMNHFDLTRLQVINLFFPMEGNNTREEVINNIQSIINGIST